MKSPRPSRSIMLVFMLVAALAAGCAYTTVAVREKYPAPGPEVRAGLNASMGAVIDARQWPGAVSTQPIPNVRIFAPEMTNIVRQGLVRAGLFTELAVPGGERAKQMRAQLKITVNNFVLANLGYNAWVVPHLLLDGAVLPVFTGVLVATKGRVDSGAYLVPSTRLGTVLVAKVQYYEEGVPGVVLEREYTVKQELEAISERRLLKSLEQGETFGVEIGKEEGRKVMDQFVAVMASDARWTYLPQWRRLALAEAKAPAAAPVAAQVAAAQGVLDLLKPLAYTEEEIKILRDGYLSPSARASIANDLRARWLNLTSVKDLPAAQAISEDQADKLFDDPSLYPAEVEALLADRALGLAVRVLTSPAPAPKAGGAPPSPESLERSKALMEKLRADLVARLKGQPRLQAMLVIHAEKAVGAAWEPMTYILAEVGEPLTLKYLRQRTG